MSGKPASRIGDGVAYGVIVQGSRTVLIGSQGGVACSACPGGVSVGNPINPLLGAKVFSDEVDLSLPGPLPFTLARDYSSYQTATPAPIGLLGPGWWLPQEPSLTLSADALTLNDTKGRSIHFEPLAPGELTYSRSESLWLIRGGCDTLGPHTLPGARLAMAWQSLAPELRRNESLIFITTSPLGPWWVFGTLGSGPTEQRLLLGGLADRFGRQQRLGRLPEGELAGHIATVIDGAGRRFELDLERIPNLARGPAHGWGADTGIRLTAVRLTHDPHHPGVPTQPLVRYHYTPRGELSAVIGRDGSTRRQFQYHPELVGRMSAHTHAGRPTTSYAYDERGRVTEQTTPGGLSYRLSYQPDSTTVTDSLGRQEIYHFAGEGGLRRVVKHQRADGSSTESRFDTSGRLVASTDPLGRQTKYDLDITTGNILSVTLPDGRQHRVEYDHRGLATQTHGAGGSLERLEYDTLGRLIVATDALEHTTRYRYPDERTHLPCEIEDPKGGKKQLDWSRLGQLLCHTDCSGNSTRYEYDRWGQIASIHGEEGARLANRYDPLGRLTARIDAANRTSTYQYDLAGDLTGAMGPEGDSVTFGRDEWGRLITFHYAGLAQHYQYDEASRLTRITNENGAHTTFAYSVRDQLIEQVNFDGRTQHYAYNAGGELTQSIDAGQISRYRYDKGGRLLERQIGEETGQDGAAHAETFRYNDNGQLIEAMHRSELGGNTIAVQFSHDKLGRIVQESQSLTNAQGHTVWQHHIHHQFDALGAQSQTILDGLPPLHWQTYGAGHLHGLTLDGRGLIDFERDKLYRETERRFAGINIHRGYDELSRLSRIETHSPEIGGALNRLHHYDPADQLTRIDTAQGQYRYDYDKAGRLIEAQLPNRAAQIYRFDPAGNRLFTHRLNGTAEQDWADTVRHNLPNPNFNVLGENKARLGSHTDTVWMSNRILDDGEYRYQYDAYGNLTQKSRDRGHEQHHYAYDSSHRLIRYALESDQTVRASNYLYDPFGRRVAKQTLEADKDGNPIGEVQTTFYGWDGDQLVLTEQGGKQIHTIYQPHSFMPLIRIESGRQAPRQSLAQKIQSQTDIALTAEQLAHFDVIEQELRQDRLSAQTLHWLDRAGFDPGHLKAMLDESAGDADRTIHLYHCDHAGTPIALIDEQGHIDWEIELDAWGNTLREHNPDKLYQPIRFQGQHFDPESGMHYNRYRYYDPKVGRYVTQDPIGLMGGIGFYSYVNGNPVNYSDPLGLKQCRGNARILQGNARHINQPGAYGANNIITANSGIIIPQQVGLTGIGQMRPHIDNISATLADGTPLFSGVRDNMGPREARERFVNNQQFVIELPGAARDLGTQEVILTIPDELNCPPNTNCVTCNNQNTNTNAGTQ